MVAGMEVDMEEVGPNTVVVAMVVEVTSEMMKTTLITIVKPRKSKVQVLLGPVIGEQDRIHDLDSDRREVRSENMT